MKNTSNEPNEITEMWREFKADRAKKHLDLKAERVALAHELAAQKGLEIMEFNGGYQVRFSKGIEYLDFFPVSGKTCYRGKYDKAKKPLKEVLSAIWP